MMAYQEMTKVEVHGEIAPVEVTEKMDRMTVLEAGPAQTWNALILDSE